MLGVVLSLRFMHACVFVSVCVVTRLGKDLKILSGKEAFTKHMQQTPQSD